MVRLRKPKNEAIDSPGERELRDARRAGIARDGHQKGAAGMVIWSGIVGVARPGRRSATLHSSFSAVRPGQWTVPRRGCRPHRRRPSWWNLDLQQRHQRTQTGSNLSSTLHLRAPRNYQSVIPGQDAKRNDQRYPPVFTPRRGSDSSLHPRRTVAMDGNGVSGTFTCTASLDDPARYDHRGLPARRYRPACVHGSSPVSGCTRQETAAGEASSWRKDPSTPVAIVVRAGPKGNFIGRQFGDQQAPCQYRRHLLKLCSEDISYSAGLTIEWRRLCREKVLESERLG